jgi:hypothetical protein
MLSEIPEKSKVSEQGKSVPTSCSRQVKLYLFNTSNCSAKIPEKSKILEN